MHNFVSHPAFRTRGLKHGRFLDAKNLRNILTSAAVLFFPRNANVAQVFERRNSRFLASTGKEARRAFLQWSSTDIQWWATQIPGNHKRIFLVFEAGFYGTSFPVNFGHQQKKIKSLNFQIRASVLEDRVK